MVTQPNGQQSTQSVAAMLQNYYQIILGGFEEVYRKNILEQQRKVRSGQIRPGDPLARMVAGSQQAGQPGQQVAGGGEGSMMGMVGQPISSGAPSNGAAPFPLQPTPQSPHLHQPPGTPSMQRATPNINAVDGVPLQSSITEYSTQVTAKVMDHEQDGVSHKRKLDTEEDDAKRARQKIGRSQLYRSLRIIDTDLQPNRTRAT